MLLEKKVTVWEKVGQREMKPVNAAHQRGHECSAITMEQRPGGAASDGHLDSIQDSHLCHLRNVDSG